MTAKTRTTAKRAAKPVARMRVVRKRVAKTQAAPVAAVKAKGGAKGPER